MKSRIRKNILKHSPERLVEYETWIKEGKPIKFAVYLLHDSTLGVKVKKIGSSTKLWARVFNGLNYKYFYNFKLLDVKYFPTKLAMLSFEKKIQKFYEKAKVKVDTYAFNRRSDLENYVIPKNLKPVLANGGSENFKEELIPNSFEEIETQIALKFNNEK